MKLQPKQSRFAHMVALLILHAEQLGYEVTLGRGYMSGEANEVDGGMPNSNHLNRLAQDLNVFKDGEYLLGEEAEVAYSLLHNYFDSIGGGERIENDLNHFSLLHNGIR